MGPSEEGGGGGGEEGRGKESREGRGGSLRTQQQTQELAGSQQTKAICQTHHIVHVDSSFVLPLKVNIRRSLVQSVVGRTAS